MWWFIHEVKSVFPRIESTEETPCSVSCDLRRVVVADEHLRFLAAVGAVRYGTAKFCGVLPQDLGGMSAVACDRSIVDLALICVGVMKQSNNNAVEVDV